MAKNRRLGEPRATLSRTMKLATRLLATFRDDDPTRAGKCERIGEVLAGEWRGDLLMDARNART